MPRRLAAALAAALAGGCSTTATIHGRNGLPDEATIVRGTSTSVMVDNGAGERAIPRSQIADIDHPGNVHAVVGAALLAYGILNISVGVPRCEEKGPAFCTGVFTPAAVGLGMSIWGLAVWSKSNRAARENAGTGPELSLAPQLLVAGPRRYGGGALTLRY
jgi:hypothetical protein